jgi:hypothetical protein
LIDPRAHVSHRLDIMPADCGLTRGARMHEVGLDIPTVAAGGLLHGHHLDRVLLRVRGVEHFDMPWLGKVRGTSLRIY